MSLFNKNEQQFFNPEHVYTINFKGYRRVENENLTPLNGEHFICVEATHLKAKDNLLRLTPMRGEEENLYIPVSMIYHIQEIGSRQTWLDKKLRQAIKSNNWNDFKEALEEGAETSYFSLVLAVVYCRYSMTEELLKRGANPNAEGLSILPLAVHVKDNPDAENTPNKTMIALLVKYGAKAPKDSH